MFRPLLHLHLRCHYLTIFLQFHNFFIANSIWLAIFTRLANLYCFAWRFAWRMWIINMRIECMRKGKTLATKRNASFPKWQERLLWVWHFVVIIIINISVMCLCVLEIEHWLYGIYMYTKVPISFTAISFFVFLWNRFKRFLATRQTLNTFTHTYTHAVIFFLLNCFICAQHTVTPMIVLIISIVFSMVASIDCSIERSTSYVHTFKCFESVYDST